jgi:hypothetical protein
MSKIKARDMVFVRRNFCLSIATSMTSDRAFIRHAKPLRISNVTQTNTKPETKVSLSLISYIVKDNPSIDLNYSSPHNSHPVKTFVKRETETRTERGGAAGTTISPPISFQTPQLFFDGETLAPTYDPPDR